MRENLILLAVLFPSVILHEVSHGAVALAFGDPTAKDAGRLTLNPIKHIDPFGTVILPAMLALSGAPAFGYAKPVPVNPRRLRHPRNHGLVVSLAGPAVNVALAVLAGVALRFVLRAGDAGPATLLEQVLFSVGIANVFLAVFNMIPLPPLDGSALVERVLPKRWFVPWMRLRQYSMVILIVVFVVLQPVGILSRLFEPAIDLWTRLL